MKTPQVYPSVSVSGFGAKAVMAKARAYALAVSLACTLSVSVIAQPPGVEIRGRELLFMRLVFAGDSALFPLEFFNGSPVPIFNPGPVRVANGIDFAEANSS